MRMSWVEEITRSNRRLRSACWGRTSSYTRGPIESPKSLEGGRRYREWIEAKRKYVEEKTGGKVGYIHVPDTGINGQNNLFRQFYGQTDKAALIVDERWNGGGEIA